jgi:hypothetical protein
MTKFLGALPKRLWWQKKIFNACSGLSTHRHDYIKMLEFSKKIFSKSTPPNAQPTVGGVSKMSQTLTVSYFFFSIL